MRFKVFPLLKVRFIGASIYNVLTNSQSRGDQYIIYIGSTSEWGFGTSLKSMLSKRRLE